MNSLQAATAPLALACVLVVGWAGGAAATGYGNHAPNTPLVPLSGVLVVDDLDLSRVRDVAVLRIRLDGVALKTCGVKPGRGSRDNLKAFAAAQSAHASCVKRAKTDALGTIDNSALATMFADHQTIIAAHGVTGAYRGQRAVIRANP